MCKDFKSIKVQTWIVPQKPWFRIDRNSLTLYRSGYIGLRIDQELLASYRSPTKNFVSIACREFRIDRWFLDFVSIRIVTTPDRYETHLFTNRFLIDTNPSLWSIRSQIIPIPSSTRNWGWTSFHQFLCIPPCSFFFKELELHLLLPQPRSNPFQDNIIKIGHDYEWIGVKSRISSFKCGFVGWLPNLS